MPLPEWTSPTARRPVNTAGQTAGAFHLREPAIRSRWPAGTCDITSSADEDTSTAAGDTFYNLDTTNQDHRRRDGLTFAIYEFDAPPGFNQDGDGHPPNAFTFGPVIFSIRGSSRAGLR